MCIRDRLFRVDAVARPRGRFGRSRASIRARANASLDARARSAPRTRATDPSRGAAAATVRVCIMRNPLATGRDSSRARMTRRPRFGNSIPKARARQCSAPSTRARARARARANARARAPRANANDANETARTVVPRNESRLRLRINERSNRVAFARVRPARRRSRRDERATDDADRTRGLGEDDEGVG